MPDTTVETTLKLTYKKKKKKEKAKLGTPKRELSWPAFGRQPALGSWLPNTKIDGSTEHRK